MSKLDEKENQLLNFIHFNNLIAHNNRIKSNSYVTQQSFNVSVTVHEIDHVIVNKNMMNIITGFHHVLGGYREV